MPYELIWEDRGVVSRLWGEQTSDEYVEWSRSIASDPRCESIVYQLIICSDSLVIKVSGATIRREADRDARASQRRPKGALAVVGSESLVRGLNNQCRIQYEVMGGLWKIETFETEEEARRWIAETLG